MSTLRITFLCLLTLAPAWSLIAQTGTPNPVQVTSPNGQITLLLFDAGAPNATEDLRYAVEFHGKRLLETARLGLDLVGQPALGPGMHLTASQPESVDETYTIAVGKTRSVRDHYNGIRADYEDATGRKLTIEVRVFDDGAAFRYLVPDQPSLKQVRIANELTEFAYAKDATTYPLILDGYQSSWEDEYQQRNVSGLHPDWIIGLPFLAEEPGLGWVAITEADIDNYAGMYLRKAPKFGTRNVKADLSPHVNDAGVSVPGLAVETSTPFSSPWRVLHDRRRAWTPHRVQHRSQPESAIEDRRHILDSGRQVGLGLVVGRGRAQRELQDRHEHRDHEALHRLCFGLGIPVHAYRRGLGNGRSQRSAGLCRARRHYARHPRSRHARVAALLRRRSTSSCGSGRTGPR